MPQRISTPLGAPCWIDLFSSDTDRATDFYGELFGWTAENAGPDYGGYINFSLDGQRTAGCMSNDGTAGTPDMWSVYLATNDATATVESAVASGATVHVPAMQVMELGSMALMADPGGAAIGAWQSGLHTGFHVVAEPGAPSWFELMTRDYDLCVAFYQHVFGLKATVVSDTPEFRYATLSDGGDPLAGIMDASGFLASDVPSSWSVYFGTADTDASLVKIVELGGTIVEAAQDTPYGRLATATDPTGTTFRLIHGNI